MNTEKIRQAAGTFETPFYIFDTDALKDRVKNIKELLAGCADLCFAMKANPFLTNALSDVVDRFEICSPGEYHIYTKYLEAKAEEWKKFRAEVTDWEVEEYLYKF